jgi:hypothetical protein
MKQISLRLPDDLHAALKAAAAREHRSLHGQIVHALNQSLAQNGKTAPE